MRPGRAVGLCLIAVVLVQAGFFAGAPPNSGGNRFVLNRGAHIPSVTSGARTVAVPDGNANAPGLSDPRIEYDGLSGRWFVTIGDSTTGQVLVAASRSTDPTLGWSFDRVPSSATSECLDQPILGVGTLNVIVSVNVYSNCFSSTYTYNGAQFWVINKTDLVTGALSPSVWSSPRYATDFSIHPVRMEGRSLTQYMVATLWDVSTD